jgi:hypothetical protein
MTSNHSDETKDVIYYLSRISDKDIIDFILELIDKNHIGSCLSIMCKEKFKKLKPQQKRRTLHILEQRWLRILRGVSERV